MARLALAVVALLTAASVSADVGVRAFFDRPRAMAGETVDLGIEVTGAQNAPVPALPGVDGLSVRYVGPATQVSIVNGQMTSSVTYHFSVTTLRPGTFTIGPIAIEVDGTRYQTAAVSLQALAPGTGTQTGPAQLRLVLSADRTEAYLHQRIPITLKLYVGSVQVGDLQYPTVAGESFAIEKLPQPTERQERTAEGTFQVLEFRVPLTPLRSGTLTVGPAHMGLTVLERRRGGDRFFEHFLGADPFAQRRPQELVSEPLVLTVLPLPEVGKPADFSGAVGQFTLDVHAAPLDLQAGDPVTVTTTIRGAGALDTVTAPTLATTDGFRVYPPQAAKPPENVPADTKVFEQVLIPERAGTVALPDIRFSFFDPEARAYRTLTRGPIALTVRAPAGTPASPQIVGARPTTPAAEPLGRDIVSIKDAPGAFVTRGTRRVGSVAFWLWQPVPLLAWLAALWWDTRRRRLTGDVRYARFTRAGREARRALAEVRAAQRAGDRASAYDTLARAVRDYLAAKLDLPPGAVTPEAVRERLGTAGTAARVADDLRDFLATCEQARFAPAGADGDLAPTLARADTIIRACERERRLGRALMLVLLVGALARVAVAADAEPPAALFFRGNALYADGRFADAAAVYEQVLADGYESGALYYNLGNAYFRAGDSGRAILNYERARRLVPRDPDVHANLGFARPAGDATDDTPVWARLAFPLATRLSGDELLGLASAAYTGLMVLLIVGLLAPGAQRVTRPGALLTALVLFLVASGAGYRLLAIDLPARAVVIAATPATVRFEPSPGGTVHFSAPTGSVLRIVGEREGWVQVARGDGARGWVERATLERL